MAAAEKPKRTPISLFALLRDVRVIQVITQIVFIVVLVAVLSVIWLNVLRTLNERRLSILFDVMRPPAGFQIAEAPDWYASSSSFGQAFLVGIVHTLQIVVPGLVMSTVIGVFIGIFLLSRNWLIRNISKVYVEVLRNTPLLVQLYFWYFIVFFALPLIREAIAFPQEGLLFIHFRVFTYALVIPVVWWFSSRASFPSRITQGALLGFIVMEIAIRASGILVDIDLLILFGSALIVLVVFLVALRVSLSMWVPGAVLGLLLALQIADLFFDIFPADGLARLDVVLAGLVTFGMILVTWFAAKQWREFATGALLILGGQIVFTGIFLHLTYFLGMSPLPDAIMLEIYPVAFFSIKGMALPELVLTHRFAVWMAFVMAGIAAAVLLWMFAGHVTETTGRPIRRGWQAALSVIGMALLGWIFITAQPVPEQLTIGEGDEAVVLPYNQALTSEDITPEQEYLNAWYPVKLALPDKSRLNYTRGTVVTPEYTALLIGLTIYTSAFIAEIVRAGIQAVPYGQLEAARALGLSYSQTLQLIILPQALRVIIPPLGNQYLNLAKNSSLAIAVAFADVYLVGQSMMNTSGQSIVGFAMIFLVYITMSLIISFVMNLVNARFQLVTR